jgi:hypothetical protein
MLSSYVGSLGLETRARPIVAMCCVMAPAIVVLVLVSEVLPPKLHAGLQFGSLVAWAAVHVLAVGWAMVYAAKWAFHRFARRPPSRTRSRLAVTPDALAAPTAALDAETRSWR